ncbi:MAG: beta-phosphoglucomutase [Lachnospirales bacterium]
MKYKAYIFDLDGVICHTDKYHYIAWKNLADRLVLPFDEEKNNLLRGVSRMESLDILLDSTKDNYSQSEKVELASEKNETYVKLLDNMSKKDLSPEVKETLLKLKDMNVKIGIGSSSKNAKFILSKLDIIDWFDTIVDGNDIKNSKPDPEVYLLAANKLGESPENCLVIEDAVAGVTSGINGGFDVAGIFDATKDLRIQIKLSKFSDILKN